VILLRSDVSERNGQPNGPTRPGLSISLLRLMGVLRDDLLQGRAVVVAPGEGGALGVALAALGARVERLHAVVEPAEEQVGERARAQGPLDALVYDAAPSFGAGGPDAVARTMEEAWALIREVALGALIESPDPGRIVLIGPPAGAGDYAEAARSALENLARTLSVEWARYAITVVMVAPGELVSESELAEVVSFLCSRGAEYFSGCRLDVG
jgi:NAD(P)-dependent dehydrogenase (short-subunit alcohol dehydrogenase family)